MSAVPKTGESWTIGPGTIVVRGAVVTGDTVDATVSYDIEHNGEPYLTGDAAWSDDEGAWLADIGLPATPGKLSILWTATSGGATGKRLQSLLVRGVRT
jgi:hypothetical protein